MRPVQTATVHLHRHLIMTLVAALCVACCASSALAQGTLGSVPDPISTRDLEQYAERLQLSRQQRQAMQSMHDQYREEFNLLRESDIESFLNSTRNLGGGFGMIMNREATSKALKQLNDVQNKIKAVDTRLFDQMQTLLTEEQLTRMNQVRQARERVRYRAGLTRLVAFINPAQQVDLSELLLDINLSAPERTAIEPQLISYESTLTAGSRRLYDTTLSLTQSLLDQLQAEQLTEDSMRNPERRGEVFQNFRTVMSEMQSQLASKAGELSDLNRRTLRTLVTSLEPQHARMLRDQYYQRAYPEVGVGGGQAARAFEIVLKFDELTEEQRSVVTTMAAEFDASLDRLMEQMMDLVDANRRSQSFFDFNQESRRRFQEQLGEQRDKRSKLNESTLASLRAALQPDMVARLDKRLGEPGSGAQDTVVTMTGVAGGMTFTAARVQTGEAENAIGNDPYIPQPISKKDLESYAQRLNLSVEERPILSSLHDDYSEKYQQLEQGDIQALREMQRNLWGMNGGQVTPPTAQAIDDLYQKRQRVIEAVMALDTSFFNDVQVALDLPPTAETIQQLRNARQRAIYARVASQGMFGERAARALGPGGRGMGMTFGRNQSAVDLIAIAQQQSLSPNDPDAFHAALSEYDQQSTAAFQNLFTTNMRMQEARDKMMAQASQNQGGDRQTRTFQMTEGVRGFMESQGRAAEDASRAITALNASTLAKLTATLSEADAQQLRRAYHRQAFPGVFNDPRSAQRHLDAALNLPSLSDQQRTQVQELALEFTNQYEQLSDRMVELEAQSSGARPDRDWQAAQEQFRTRERLYFERNDLNDKTIARLRSALSEQQVQQLGGLELESEESQGFRFRGG